MPITQRFPFVPRAIVALMSIVLLSVVGVTLASAQDSEPVSTGTLTVVGDNAVAPGEEVELRGAGYAPGGSIAITIESEPRLLATVQADAAGAFRATVTIPTDITAGEHTLKATGPDASGGLRVLSADITVIGALPRTGSDAAALTLAGLAAVSAGAATVIFVRRRRAA